MNRNGILKTIWARMDEPGYTLEQAKKDIAYLIDYARGLEEDNRDLRNDLAWAQALGDS